VDESLLRAGDLGFLVALGAICILVARDRGRRMGGSRDLELACLIIIAPLALVGFALAHAGMNYSWTGHAFISDWRWLALPAAVVTAVFVAHITLRIAGSRLDQVVLPVFAVLSLLGLISVYVWEVRDANAYISGQALPSMHQYLGDLADAPADLASSATQTNAVLKAPDATKALLASVPEETAYELDPVRSGRDMYATALNLKWVRAYNEAVERFDQHVADYPPVAAGRPELHQVSVYSYTYRQAAATVIAVLFVPVISWLLTSGRLALGRRRFLIASGAGLVALALAGVGLSSSAVPALPLLPGVGIYEPLKLALVVFLVSAMVCYRSSGSAGRLLIVVLAGGGVIGALSVFASRDLGSGLVLALLSGGMLVMAAAGRSRDVLLGVAGVAALGLLVGLCTGSDLLPSRTQARVDGWLEPRGSLEAARQRDATNLVFQRIVQRRLDQHGAGESGKQLPKLIDSDLDALLQELHWRLKTLDRWSERKGEPLIPFDTADELLLSDAETLWYSIGGYDLGAIVSSPNDVRELSSRLQGVRQRFDGALLDLRRNKTDPAATGGPLFEPPGDGFQLLRAAAALEAGGLLGVGLGRGRPEVIPGVTEDAAFVAVGEALGAAGALLVTLLFLLLLARPFRAGPPAASSAHHLLARGFALALGLQAFISVAGLLGVLPYTGVGYPFISRSGMSMLASALMVAVIGTASIPAGSLEQTAQPSAPSPGRRQIVGAIARAGVAASVGYMLLNLLGLQLARRSLAPGTLPSGLRPVDAPGAVYQWRAPTGYRHLPGPILDRHGDLLVQVGARASGWSSTGWSSTDAEMAACAGHLLQALLDTTANGPGPPSATPGGGA